MRTHDRYICMYFIRCITEFRVKTCSGSETINAAAVNGARPTLSTKMIVCREREENTGGEVLLCWSFRSLRKLQDDARLSPLCKPYVFEGVDEGDR